MKTTEIIIRIYDEVGGDAAISVSDGDEIYKKIDAAISNQIVVVLDFQNVNLIITSFLNACIGQLYSKYNSAELNQSLKFKNIKQEYNHLIVMTKKRAKEYFEDPAGFDKSLSEVLGS